jgi:hypothetical protein
MMIPGRALHWCAARICCSSTLERVVEPAIADLQKEYAEAAGTGSVKRAWTLVRGYFAILEVIAMGVFGVSDATDDDRQAIARIIAWAFALTTIFIVVLILPPLYSLGGDVGGWSAAATLVPQAVPLAIPCGVVFGLALGLRGRAHTGSAKMLLIGALAASVVSFAVLAWGMPAANQAFREIAFRQLKAPGYEGPVTLQKGHNEMTFTELRREIEVLSAAGSRQAREAAFSFHLRFSLAAATLALASLLLAVRTKQRELRLLIAVGSCLAYWMLLYAGDAASLRGYMTPPMGAWLPNVTLIASALIIASSSSSRLRGRRVATQ